MKTSDAVRYYLADLYGQVKRLNDLAETQDRLPNQMDIARVLEEVAYLCRAIHTAEVEKMLGCSQEQGV